MKSRQFRPQISFRHMNSPVSPPPDHMGILIGGALYRESTATGQPSVASDRTGQFSKQSGLGLDRREGFMHPRQRAFVTSHQRAANVYSLPPIRNRSLSRNTTAHEVPKIYICPAPKFVKPSNQNNKWDRTRSSKTYYHRPSHQHARNDQLLSSEFAELNKENISYVDVPVNIPVQVHGESPVEDPYDHKNDVVDLRVNPPITLPKKKADAPGMKPNTVNLNDGFDAVSALYGREISLNVALSRRYAAKSSNKTPVKRKQAAVMNYLPLREVYLKSENSNDRESQARHQQEKMMRIWSWLKKLNYMNEEQFSVDS